MNCQSCKATLKPDGTCGICPYPAELDKANTYWEKVIDMIDQREGNDERRLYTHHIEDQN